MNIPSKDAAKEPKIAVELRHALTHELGRERITDARVLAAMDAVPRHSFVPEASLRQAYENHPQTIGYEQTISQPLIVALMTQALALVGTERVLEIGTGSGYQAAILSLLAREVVSLEVLAPLARSATERLASLGHHNVEVLHADGFEGCEARAPFDRILLTAAPDELPQKLLDQLGDGGLLVAPIGRDRQILVRVRREGEVFRQEKICTVRFVPMVHGARSSIA
jgi:protein-L-isoaspartate(D-aspartate) O-methyltransferase